MSINCKIVIQYRKLCNMRNKIFFIIILITIVFLVGKNYLKESVEKEIGCSFIRSEEYFNAKYKLLREKNIKIYIFKEGQTKEVSNVDEFMSSLIVAEQYAQQQVGGKWFYTKRKFFSMALGIDKEARVKFISIPEEKKEEILKNIDRYPRKYTRSACDLLQVMLGDF